MRSYDEALFNIRCFGWPRNKNSKPIIMILFYALISFMHVPNHSIFGNN